ncbi:uncharacterized protein LOC128193734 [Vigna angularis]|uniref:uncharacterized protein LOC128193734 n=1 Tax=Phaseolus angularis TaxID=3914 RepID=UPI0022B5BE49|nr:uncharacterized protein LOC128193734 [Vigna angularis]
MWPYFFSSPLCCPTFSLSCSTFSLSCHAPSLPHSYILETILDPSNLLPANGLEEVYQNGVNGKLSNSKMDGIASNVDPAITKIAQTEAPNGISKNFIQYDSTATDFSSKAEIKEGLGDCIGVNNVTISKEVEAEIVDQTEQSKAGKCIVKSKNAKSPSPRGVHASAIKKNIDGKGEKVASTVSNGTFASDSIPREHIKNRSLTDKQARLSKVCLSHMACQVGDGIAGLDEVTFLYRLTPGACPKSYGVNVARIVGLPTSVLQKAASKSREFEASYGKCRKVSSETNSPNKTKSHAIDNKTRFCTNTQ